MGGNKSLFNYQLPLNESCYITAFIKFAYSKDSHLTVVTKYFAKITHLFLQWYIIHIRVDLLSMSQLVKSQLTALWLVLKGNRVWKVWNWFNRDESKQSFILHNNIMLVCATTESGSLLPIEKKIFSLLQLGATQNNVCNLMHACN